MSLTALFGTIYESYGTISANFYLYLSYFQKKVSVSAKSFSFSKISESQIDLKNEKRLWERDDEILCVTQV